MGDIVFLEELHRLPREPIPVWQSPLLQDHFDFIPLRREFDEPVFMAMRSVETTEAHHEPFFPDLLCSMAFTFYNPPAVIDVGLHRWTILVNALFLQAGLIESRHNILCPIVVPTFVFAVERVPGNDHNSPSNIPGW